MGARAALDLSDWPTPDISWDDAQSLLAAGGFSPFALPRWMGKTRAQIVAMVSARIEAVSAECAEREQMLSTEWAVE